MIKAILTVTAASAALIGCSGPAQTETAHQESPTTSGMTPAARLAPSASASGQSSSAAQNAVAVPEQLSAEAAKGAPGARAVIAAWARALENHQFGAAWDQFRNPPASRDAYARWWQRYRTMNVQVNAGTIEGAAGSLYYSAPVTITGTTSSGDPFRLAGEVILRHVNDVEGATPEQLRWHIDSADLKDA
ncbi:hypothetical protein ABVV53_07920 [Novosphingobium sp. RD2P27]|uniref:Lipoprotein n=1 Tax=Novosphingobium kalidii TaxID=3230299 RepID=A0ABV2D0J9_9SPHN